MQQPRRHRVVRHASAHGRWTAIHYLPDRRLRPHVRLYQGFVEEATRFEARREMPSGDVSWVIGFDSEVRVYERAGAAGWSEYRRAFVTGLDDAWALTDTGGRWTGIEVRFTRSSAVSRSLAGRRRPRPPPAASG